MNDLGLTAYHSAANCDKNSPTFVHNSPEQYFPFLFFFFLLTVDWTNISYHGLQRKAVKKN